MNMLGKTATKCAHLALQTLQTQAGTTAMTTTGMSISTSSVYTHAINKTWWLKASTTLFQESRSYATASKETTESNTSSQDIASTSESVLEPLPRKARRAAGFPKIRRCGAIAVKCGMTQEWDQNGVRVPLTVLWLDENKVIQVKSKQKDGYVALQVGAGARKMKRVPGSLKQHFSKYLSTTTPSVSRKIAEFRVTEECVMESGMPINANHFVPGQFVDIQGITIGKGFQGGMKRHGFKGGPASHGTSKAHRTIGSTGQCQNPGRVFKGKKMPGQMGGKKRTAQSLFVYKVDPKHNLIWVKGSVPGHKGNFVTIKDAVLAFQDVALPLPTALEHTDDISVSAMSTKTNPFTQYWQ